MQRSIYFFLVLTLTLLLAACGATEAATVPNDFVTATPNVSRPDTPTPEPPMTKEAMVTEEPLVTEESVLEEPTATMEVIPTEEMAAPSAEVTAPPTEEMMAEENKAMAEQVNLPPPSAAQQQLLASLPVVGTPPELTNEVWLNSGPLQLADLRGKVVIVEFWTFG